MTLVDVYAAITSCPANVTDTTLHGVIVDGTSARAFAVLLAVHTEVRVLAFWK